ncbi:hypothetical protein FGO68_gene3496 [Halteria grandinella]|uniref:Uncharacterized protein n=1 Tax=Halteria grandinella TaxID=5974 RepID=A0A8J8NQR0_HALGN|nr:hypothetical protein FGO68_gene3496 [Halteria grandinella]
MIFVQIAYQMTNCHLSTSGKPPLPPCQHLPACASSLQGELWNTYTLMFTHAQQTCQYVKMELRQEGTQTLMKQLEETSQQVRSDMQVSFTLILPFRLENLSMNTKNQALLNETLSQAEKLLSGQDEIFDSLLLSQELAQIALDRMRIQLQYSESLSDGLVSLESQVQAGQEKVGGFFQDIMGKIETIERLQGLIAQHSFGLSSIVFYASYFGFVWFITSFKPLRESRMRLLSLTASAILLERFSVFSGITHGESFSVSDSMIPKFLLCILTVLSLLYQRYTYINYNQENNRLLRQVLVRCQTLEQTPAWLRKYRPVVSHDFQGDARLALRFNPSPPRHMEPTFVIPSLGSKTSKVLSKTSCESSTTGSSSTSALASKGGLKGTISKKHEFQTPLAKARTHAMDTYFNSA